MSSCFPTPLPDSGESSAEGDSSAGCAHACGATSPRTGMWWAEGAADEVYWQPQTWQVVNHIWGSTRELVEQEETGGSAVR